MNNLFICFEVRKDPTHCQLAAVFFEPSTGRIGQKFTFTGARSFSRGIFPKEALADFNQFVLDNQHPQGRNNARMWFGAGSIDHEVLCADFYAHQIIPRWNLTSCYDHFTLQTVARSGGWDGYLPPIPATDLANYATTCGALISEAWQFLITPRVENWRNESELTTRKSGAL